MEKLYENINNYFLIKEQNIIAISLSHIVYII